MILVSIGITLILIALLTIASLYTKTSVDKEY